MIRTCLFSNVEHNLKALLRRGAPIDEMLDFIVATIEKKEDRHHINDPEFVQPLRTMSCIGG